MTAQTTPTDTWLSQFIARKRNAPWPDAPWIDLLRQAAFGRFCALGFPTARNEDWRYTDVEPIAATLFEPAPVTTADADTLAPFTRGNRLVFVNGRLQRPVPTLPRGVTAGLLSGQKLKNGSELTSNAWERLAKCASFEANAFVALNTAFLGEAACIYVAREAVVEEPIHLVHITIPDSAPIVSHPRTLIVVGEFARCTFVETYLGTGDYFSNSVTEISVGAGASVDHYKIQTESVRAFHVSTLSTEIARDARYCTTSIALGGGLVRNNSGARLAEGSNATLNGLYLVEGSQHVDNQLTVDHAEPNAASVELYKGILNDAATAAFNGKIVVRKDAQKTDAKQTNQNLMLSDDAVVNAKPELQIFADDVKCTHGATVGQLDAEAAFYLRSRGIGPQEARGMLTYAFAKDVIDRVKVAPVRSMLERALFEKLA
ncbi:MAG: Fe-S cluster assembly protein SufD [Candidatus Velthaea sp.]|jgi:Fe-S cluster assembly protein SufD